MKNTLAWKLVVVIGLITLLTVSSSFAAEEKWPTKPVKISIAYGPGGTTDLSTRLLASLMEKELGQKVICENTPGGAGVVAASLVVQQKPDGYSLVTLPPTPAIISPHRQKLSYDPLKDLTPICQFASWHYGLVVRADSDFKTFNDLLAYGKENPGKLSYGLSGSGNTQHLVMEKIKMATGVDWTAIPFKSGAEAVSACLGGHVTMMAGVTEWVPQVKSGELRLLAVFDAERMKEFPDVPTLKELGYDIPVKAFLGLAGPAGIPPHVVDKLNVAVSKAVNEPEFVELMDKILMRVEYANSSEFSEKIKSGYEEEGKVLKMLGMAMEN